MSYHTECAKIKLKPDSLERVREWARTLNETRRDEAMATLRDETVVLEAVFLDQTAEGDFLIYIVKAKSFEKSKQAAATSSEVPRVLKLCVHHSPVGVRLMLARLPAASSIVTRLNVR